MKIQSLVQREWKEGVCEAQATDAGGVGDRSTPYLCRVSDHGAEGQCCGCYVQAGQGLPRMDDCAAVEDPKALTVTRSWPAKKTPAAMCDWEDPGGGTQQGQWYHHRCIRPIRGVHHAVHKVRQLLQSHVGGSDRKMKRV